MKMSNNIYDRAIEHYGKEHQINKTKEELAELIVALCKMDKENIAEEVADVEIMLIQLKEIFDNDYKVDNIKEQKLKRLNNRIIAERSNLKAVGDANRKIKEDPLRILRAIRFVSRLNLDMDYELLVSILKYSKLLNEISKERIREEFLKCINYNSIKIMEKTGVLKILLPELQKCVGLQQNNSHHSLSVFNHTLEALKYNQENNEKNYINLAILLHDIGKYDTKTTEEISNTDHFYGHEKVSSELTERIMKRFKFDNETTYKVVTLVSNHMSHIFYDAKTDEIYKKGIKKLLNKIGDELFQDLLSLKVADFNGQNPSKINKSMIHMSKLYKFYEEIKNYKEPFSLKDLNLNGKDLIKLGIEESKNIGIILNKLLDEVIGNPELNEKNILIEIVKGEYQC